jgi:hypothetical protein
MVRLAVALLPKRSRDRYREQWQGELRDAETVDIAPMEIATGALTFAARLDRPMPSWVRTTRPRVSVALALSAALLALSQYASLVPVTDGYGAIKTSGSVTSTPLIAWVDLIPVVAFVMVMASRRASFRERLVVVLLVVASYLPFFRGMIDERIPSPFYSDYLTVGTSVYAAAAILIATSVVLAWREYRLLRPSQRPDRVKLRLTRSIVAGATVAALVVLCTISAATLWASRELIVFGDPVDSAHRAEFEEWVTIKIHAEDMISNLLTGWAIVGIIAALAIAAFAFSRRSTLRRTIALAAGAVCVVLVCYGGLVMFLQIMAFRIVPTVPVDLVMWVGRVGMIVVVLATVGRRREPNDANIPASPNVGITMTVRG